MESADFNSTFGKSGAVSAGVAHDFFEAKETSTGDVIE